MLTLGQAAKMTSQGKTTLTRAIKSGKLSAIRKEDGSYEIDPAELSRVYTVNPNALETPETGDGGVAVVRDETPAETLVTPSPDNELLIKLAALDAEVVGLKALLSEVRSARDDWKDQAVRLALVKPAEIVVPVAAPVPTPTPAPVASHFKLSDIWRRLAS